MNQWNYVAVVTGTWTDDVDLHPEAATEPHICNEETPSPTKKRRRGGKPLLSVHDSIRHQIRKSGLSYAEVARRAGLEESTVRKFVTGKSVSGRYESIDAICRAMNLRLWMIDREGRAERRRAREMDTLKGKVIRLATR